MSRINQNGSALVRPNFNESELSSGSSDAPDQFDLNDRILNALQSIRDMYGVPIIIKSTGRTISHNNKLTGASKVSQHLFRYNGSTSPASGVIPTVNAIDWQFKDYNEEGTAGYNAHNDFYDRMKDDNWLFFPPFYNNDVNAVGLYDSFYHIDGRTLKSNGTGYQWDSSSKKKSNFSVVQNALSGNDEDGILGAEKQIKHGLITFVAGLLIVGAIVGGIIYYKKTKK